MFMGCLLLLSCDEKLPEPEAEYPSDQETAKIEGELSLMNISNDAESRNLTVGNNFALKKMGEDPAQATQAHEKIFLLGPISVNSRILLVGKIRLEVCKENKDFSKSDSHTKQSHDLNKDSDLNPE